MKGKKRERILRILLNNPDGCLTKYRIARSTGTSTSWTQDYLRYLHDRKLIEGTKVIDPVGLFKEWIDISASPKHFDFFIGDPKGFLRSVNKDYSLTTYFAENYFSKILFPTRADIYIKMDDYQQWKENIIEKKGLIGKGNLRLLISEDDQVFEETSMIDGMRIVSKTQLILDLLREGGVCYQAFEIMVRDYVR